MPSNSKKPLIFISYAHADETAKRRTQWLTFVMKFLRPAVKGGDFAIWVDSQMPGGTKWDEEIERNLRACDIFILLVSANSMGSDYIIDKELQIARERQAAGDLHVFPLLLRPTPRAGLDRIRDFNLRPRDAQPLSRFELPDREKHMSEAADEIAVIAAAIAERKATAASDEVKGRDARIRSHSRPTRHFLRAPGRPRRGAERLDEAWSDDRTNILSLLGVGGVGKSALVNEWLARLQADFYRGADCVLGWSFHRQGSRERATTADEFLDWALSKLGVKVELASASAKGEAIAEALMTRRALIVLDSVELAPARARSASGPAQGPGSAGAVAPVRRRAVASGP